VIKLADIARLRLRVQRLTIGSARFATPEQVVGWLGAVQSQEYALAKWSVGMRMAGRGGKPASESSVESAVAEGRILRTHVLRPTWHFVLPRDIHSWMRLTAARWSPMLARRHGQLGLDARQIARALDAIAQALARGRQLTRPELGAAIEQAGVTVDGQRLAFIVMAAETELIVASGAHRGSAPTYAPLPAAAAPFDRDAALAELTLRYFTSHGPATIGDFTWWSTLTVADARRGIAANPTLERLTVDGTDYWWAPDSAAGPSDPSPTAHLLQAFDEYVVGYRSPRTPINLGAHGPHTALNRPSWLHSFFLDGQLTGWWRRKVTKSGLAIETAPLRDMGTREKSALQGAIDRYLDFVGS
jgi:hypothetical protein